MKIQPFGKYRIISIATDGKKHEWNLTINPDRKAWTLAHTEVSAGDYIKGFLIKEVYEVFAPVEETEKPVHKRIDRKIVNSKSWLKVLELESRSRKSTQNSFNDSSFKFESGIYRIKNETNGNFYIGRSWNVGKRWRTHFNELQEGVHHNHLLQEDWWWSLEGKFLTFELLERCDNRLDELVEFEQEYIDEYFGKPNCYNLSPYAHDASCYIKEVNIRKKLKKKWDMNRFH